MRILHHELGAIGVPLGCLAVVENLGKQKTANLP
jgi:hypothetical protein